MDTYPLDVVLAVAAASATIFLGFLAAKTLSSVFFAREALKATVAWFVIAAISPLSVMHFPFILAVLCFIAWWNFQRDDAFTGKIWLSLASGLGISIGVMVILAVTPDSLPRKPLETSGTQGWDGSQACYLASLYLGGAMIGLAYVGYVLCREAITHPGIGGLIRNCVGLLFNLTLLRGGVLLLEIMTIPGVPVRDLSLFHHDFFTRASFPHAADIRLAVGLLVGAGVFLVLPALAYFALRATRFSSRLQPMRLLVALMLAGLATEILARLELR